MALYAKLWTWTWTSTKIYERGSSMDLWGKERKIFCFCLNPALDLGVLYPAPAEPALVPHPKEISPGQLHSTGSCGNPVEENDCICVYCPCHLPSPTEHSPWGHPWNMLAPRSTQAWSKFWCRNCGKRLKSLHGKSQWFPADISQEVHSLSRDRNSKIMGYQGRGFLSVI